MRLFNVCVYVNFFGLLFYYYYSFFFTLNLKEIVKVTVKKSFGDNPTVKKLIIKILNYYNL